jgi:hypothetical protein
VLEGTDRVAPVTFHAGRNAFAQGRDDAGLTDEQTRELLDDESVKVTQKYQRRLARWAKLVPNVLPELDRRLASRRGPAGRQCAQGGHIQTGRGRRTGESPGFHRGSGLRGGDMLAGPQGAGASEGGAGRVAAEGPSTQASGTGRGSSVAWSDAASLRTQRS